MFNIHKYPSSESKSFKASLRQETNQRTAPNAERETGGQRDKDKETERHGDKDTNLTLYLLNGKTSTERHIHRANQFKMEISENVT